MQEPTSWGAPVAGRRGPFPGVGARSAGGTVAARYAPRRAARAGAALAVALPLALAAAQSGLEPLGPLPASADRFREDLALLAGRVSAEAAQRWAQVEAAREELERARSGLTVALEASPDVGYELDLARDRGGWEPGFGAELELGAARDEDRVLRAQAALAAAEGRYRAQLRADLRAGLLALSQERLARRALESAESAAERAAASLAAAEEAGAPQAELSRLEVEAGLAAVELERERLAYRPREVVLASLGVAGTPQDAGALLRGPVPRGVVRASPHREAAALAVAAERADLAARNLPFEHLREVELAASYRDGGLRLGAELGLRRGVPTADARLGWQTGGGGHRLQVGVSVNLLFSNGSSRRSTLVLAERELALQALAEFEAAQPAREREALSLLELAYEELRLLLVARDAAVDELAEARASGRDTSRLEASATRAEDAAERAWQRYVRALFDYLDTTDAVLGGA